LCSASMAMSRRSLPDNRSSSAVNTRAPCPAASCAPAATARTSRSTHVACARRRRFVGRTQVACCAIASTPTGRCAPGLPTKILQHPCDRPLAHQRRSAGWGAASSVCSDWPRSRCVERRPGGRQTYFHMDERAAGSPQIATSRPISTIASRGSLKYSLTWTELRCIAANSASTHRGRRLSLSLGTTVSCPT